MPSPPEYDVNPLMCAPAAKVALEIRNQKTAFEYVTEFFWDDPTRSPYTTTVLLELHRITIKDIYPCSGNFRTALNKLKIIGTELTGSHASRVRSDVEDVLTLAREHAKAPRAFGADILVATHVFHRLLHIHPFSGGNGRVTRWLLALMLYDLKILAPPYHLSDYIESRRAPFYPALRAADRGDMGPLGLYLSRGITLCRLQQLLLVLEEAGITQYVMARLDRDQRRACDPRHHLSMNDEQFRTTVTSVFKRVLRIVNRYTAERPNLTSQ